MGITGNSEPLQVIEPLKYTVRLVGGTPTVEVMDGDELIFRKNITKEDIASGVINVVLGHVEE